MKKLFLTLFLSLFALSASAALTITPSSVDDWTACAANTIVEGSTVTVSDSYQSILHIQAGLDTTTAHEGTKFVVQISANTTGNEDWHNFTEFVEMIGTATTDAIENAPLNAGETSLTLTGHALTVEGIWILIENGTLVNSELIFVASQTANAVVALDGVTNAHVATTAVFNIAFTKNILLPLGVVRTRVIIDNSYDGDGTASSLNYRIRITETTGL